MTISDNEPQSDWITAKEALAALCVNGRSPVEIKAMLAEYLRDGQLTAYVEAMWTSTERNLGTAFKSSATADDLTESFVVPVKYWRSDKRLSADRGQWRWPYNKFFYTIMLKPLKRRMFKGVSFSLCQLRALQPQLELQVELATTKSKRGRKPNFAARDAGWMEVVRISQEGTLHLTAYQSQTELAKHLLERLPGKKGEDRLGENQVREIARMVFGALKPPH